MTRKRRKHDKDLVIHSAFNDDYGTAPKKRVTSPKSPARRVIIVHFDKADCTFSRGRKHPTVVTTADGQRYLDITLVQRCKCGERKITRISRTPIEELPD